MPHATPNVSHRTAGNTTPASSATKRPKFDQMWTLYQNIAPSSDESYPDGVIDSLQTVGDIIGGHVKINIDLGIQEIKNHPDNFPVNPQGFTNACAIRISYVLNKSGIHIPKSTRWNSVTGSDHQNYIYQVEGIRAFLLHTFGAPDVDKGVSAQPDDFADMKGMMVFDLHFADASGHATLWNGSSAADHDYFLPREGLTLTRVRLWKCN